jgi:hypothetical protein
MNNNQLNNEQNPIPLPQLPADNINNIQLDNAQNHIPLPQLPHGIALPKSFSGAFEKHVYNNYLFTDGNIPANYQMSNSEFLQLKSHIEIEYGPLYSALLKKSEEIVKRVHHKHHILHRTLEEETSDKRAAREVVRIASENKAAKDAAETVRRDQRILRLQHLAGLAVNCEEYITRLDAIINYNNSDLFSYTNEEIQRCKLIFDEHIPFKNAMNAGSNDDENCAELAVTISSRIEIFAEKLKDHHLDWIDLFFSSLRVQIVVPAAGEGLVVGKTKGPKPGIPQKKDSDPVGELKGGINCNK